jgi:hypothetical protein
VRSALLTLTMVAFFIAIVHSQRWDLFGIAPSWDSDHNADTWMSVAGIFFAASFHPWVGRFDAWYDRR